MYLNTLKSVAAGVSTVACLSDQKKRFIGAPS